MASHGYIVVAIDHTYVSAATAFPDHIVSSTTATTNFNVGDPAAVISQIMADDASFVLDRLEALNAGAEASRFQGRLDLRNVAVVGHSVGGAVAYNLALNERRVKAAVNLDGRVYVTPQDNAAPGAAVLMVANDTDHIQTLQHGEGLLRVFDALPADEQQLMLAMYGSKDAYMAVYQTSLETVRGLIGVLHASGQLYTIAGSDHMQYSDIGLFFGFKALRQGIGIRGTTDPARCLEITGAVITAFLDEHLKQATDEPMTAVLHRYPELKNVDLK